MKKSDQKTQKMSKNTKISKIKIQCKSNPKWSRPSKNDHFLTKKEPKNCLCCVQIFSPAQKLFEKKSNLNPAQNDFDLKKMILLEDKICLTSLPHRKNKFQKTNVIQASSSFQKIHFLETFLRGTAQKSSKIEVQKWSKNLT